MSPLNLKKNHLSLWKFETNVYSKRLKITFLSPDDRLVSIIWLFYNSDRYFRLFSYMKLSRSPGAYFSFMNIVHVLKEKDSFSGLEKFGP